MYYKTKNGVITDDGVWDEKSCVRRVGGFDIDKTNLPTNLEFLPKGAPVYVKANGKAALVKTAVVYEDAAESATTIKVEKGHYFNVGDTVAGSAISAIANGDNYDTLTVAALSAAVSDGDVVADENASKVAGLVYSHVKLDDSPSCSITLQAYEIEEDTLPYPINETIKTALTARHAFKL